MGTCPAHGNPVLFDRAFYVDPYPLYTRLHREGPVHRMCLASGTPVWLVTRYEDVRDGLKDARLARHPSYAGEDYQVTALPEGADRAMLVMEDPPEHTRTRRFVNFAFQPKRVLALQPRIDEVVRELLDAFPDEGEVDLVTAFAAALPITMICELLGVPVDDRPQFRVWTDDLLGGTDAERGQAFMALDQFFRKLTSERRERPQDDLLSFWTTAQDIDGEGLADEQMLNLALVVLAGGYDATAGTIAGAVLDLVRHPDERAEMMADPAGYPAAVEELIRRNSATQRGFRRFATQDLEIAGTPIARGDTVFLSFSAAGRDGGHFAEPDELDFGRANLDHLAFGLGPHFCPGSELARAEVRTALWELFTRFPDLALAVDPAELPWRDYSFIRSLTSLPVTLGGRCAP